MKKMHLYITIIFVISFLNLTTTAQQAGFSKIYFDETEGFHVFGADRSPDHGFVLVGKKFGMNGHIIKIDSSGQEEWTRQISSPGKSCELHDILCNSDSTIVSSGLLYSYPELKLNLIKWNSLGDTLWTKHFTGMEYVHRIKVTGLADGGYLLTASMVGYNSLPGTRSLLIRLTEQGDILWSRKYTSSLYDILTVTARELPDGGIIIAGEVQNTEIYEKHAFIALTDNNGLPEWSEILLDNEAISNSSVYDIAIADGIIALAEVENRVTLIKLDFSGLPVWSESYTTAGYSMSTNSPGSIVPLSDGGYIISYPGYFGGNMIKTNSSGDPVWHQFVFMDLVEVMPAVDGGYITFGNGPVYGIKTDPGFMPHTGVYKTDSVGYNENCIFPMIVESYDFTAMFRNLNIETTQAGLSANATVSASSFPLITEEDCVVFIGGLKDYGNNVNSLTISPNPASTFISVDSGLPLIPGSELEIISVTGSLIRKISYTDNPFPVSLTDLPNGIYLLRLINNQQYLTGKLVVDHK